jgi:Fur family ferric uptake transcriptional regulator
MELICEVHASGNCQNYLIKRNDKHHHHVVCQGCGKVEDFIDCKIDEIANQITNKTGFSIRKHILEFSGFCKKCKAEIDK